MAHQSTFQQQLKATLIRNLRLKIRDSKKTAAEILIPIYTLCTLIVLKVLIPNPNFPAILEAQGDGKIFEHFNPMKNHTIAVLPGNGSRHQTIQVWLRERPLNSSILKLYFSVPEHCQLTLAVNATCTWHDENHVANV